MALRKRHIDDVTSGSLFSVGFLYIKTKKTKNMKKLKKIKIKYK